jgi:hypothetical protein
MKMQAPEGVTNAAVENDKYEVDENGHIEINNGEHIPVLEMHGFTQVADEAGATQSEPEPADPVGPKPDFTRFQNKQSLLDWLLHFGHHSADINSSRAELEATCDAHHAALASGEAELPEPPAPVEPAPEEIAPVDPAPVDPASEVVTNEDPEAAPSAE